MGQIFSFFMLMNEGPNDQVSRLLVNKRKREVVANICGIEGYRVKTLARCTVECDGN